MAGALRKNSPYSVPDCSIRAMASGVYPVSQAVTLSLIHILRGGLSVQRKAKYLIRQRHIDESAETRENRIVCAYALSLIHISPRQSRSRPDQRGRDF